MSELASNVDDKERVDEFKSRWKVKLSAICAAHTNVRERCNDNFVIREA